MQVSLGSCLLEQPRTRCLSLRSARILGQSRSSSEVETKWYDMCMLNKSIALLYRFCHVSMCVRFLYFCRTCYMFYQEACLDELLVLCLFCQQFKISLFECGIVLSRVISCIVFSIAAVCKCSVF